MVRFHTKDDKEGLEQIQRLVCVKFAFFRFSGRESGFRGTFSRCRFIVDQGEGEKAFNQLWDEIKNSK